MVLRISHRFEEKKSNSCASKPGSCGVVEVALCIDFRGFYVARLRSVALVFLILLLHVPKSISTFIVFIEVKKSPRFFATKNSHKTLCAITAFKKDKKS